MSKHVEELTAKFDRDPEDPSRWVGVVYFERPHPQLSGRKNQYVLRTGIRHTEGAIRAWCRTNLDAVTQTEVDALLRQQADLSVVPTERPLTHRKQRLLS